MKNFDPVTEDRISSDHNFPASMRPFFFESEGEKILGTFFYSSGEGPHPLVILLHGFPGNEVNFDIAHAIRRYGFNVCVFHYRGSWGSGGKFSWSNCIKDAENALAFFRNPETSEEFRTAPDKILLAGHSMGGFISLLLTAKDNKLKNAASFAMFNYGMVCEVVSKEPEAKKTVIQRLAEGALVLNTESAQELYIEMENNCKEWNLLKYAPKLVNKNVYLAAAKFDSTSHFELHHAPFANMMRKAGAVDFYDKIFECGHSFSDCRIALTRSIIKWLETVKF